MSNDIQEWGSESKMATTPMATDIRQASVVTRAQKEIEGSIILAKKFPRDEQQAYNRIVSACRRVGMAEKAVYAYKRGSEQVEGPSIRLAEVAARAWGNLDFGLRELERNSQTSLVEAYCWDLETNTKRRLEFEVTLARYTKKGVVHLENDRDIYEHIANFGARRLRNCILACIPDDVTADAVAECKKTMARGYQGDNKKDAIRKMILAFDEIGITSEQIKKYLNLPNIEAAHESQFVKLRQIYASIKDGVALPGEFFEMPTPNKVIQDGFELDTIEQLKNDILLELDGVESSIGKTVQEITGTDVRAQITATSVPAKLNALRALIKEIDARAREKT